MTEQQSHGVSSSQRAGLDARTADQDRTLAAIHQLEAALGQAAPGREATWRKNVVAALAVLRDATRDEDHNANEPDSLLSDIKRTQPLLGTRVRALRAHYRQLRDAIESLLQELEDRRNDDATDYGDIRQRAAWVLAALRHQRARESDLIYEAYYDAFRAELGHDEE
jgi:hypothetical protein